MMCAWAVALRRAADGCAARARQDAALRPRRPRDGCPAGALLSASAGMCGLFGFDVDEVDDASGAGAGRCCRWWDVERVLCGRQRMPAQDTQSV
eukprot:1250310-Rhodomonas_salina.1